MSRESLVRSVHELLNAVEAERKWITVLTITLLFFAPFSILVGGFLTILAFFSPSFNWRNPISFLAAFTFLLYFVLPFFWAFVGVRELRFVRRWRRRLKKLGEIESELEKQLAS